MTERVPGAARAATVESAAAPLAPRQGAGASGRMPTTSQDTALKTKATEIAPRRHAVLELVVVAPRPPLS